MAERAGLSARLASRRGEVTEMLNRALRAMAHHGDVVILGRGGYAALRDDPDVLNVRVQAPLTVRARRVLRGGRAPSIEAAERLVKESDKRRAAFVKFSYGLEWGSAHEFDLVVDTAKLSKETAAALIAGAAKSFSPSERTVPQGSEYTGDAVLADSVADALGCHVRHAGPPSAEAARQPV